MTSGAAGLLAPVVLGRWQRALPASHHCIGRGEEGEMDVCDYERRHCVLTRVKLHEKAQHLSWILCFLHKSVHILAMARQVPAPLSTSFFCLFPSYYLFLDNGKSSGFILLPGGNQSVHSYTQ